MALDEPNNTDTQFDIDGFKYLVNSEFLERAKPISVDFHMYGFKLDSGMQFGAGCACSTDKKKSCGC